MYMPGVLKVVQNLLNSDLICIAELVLELLIISLEEALAVAIVCSGKSSEHSKDTVLCKHDDYTTMELYRIESSNSHCAFNNYLVVYVKCVLLTKVSKLALLISTHKLL
jgi:hypothetical protein